LLYRFVLLLRFNCRFMMNSSVDFRNELVIEGTRIGVWDWNIQTGETFFNERWAEIIGYTIKDLEPISIQTWMRFAHPEDLLESNLLLEKHFRGESDYYDYQTRMKHKNGHWVWVHDRGKVFEWDAEGKPLRMCGSHIDITEQKESELRLKRLIEEKDVLLAEVHHRVKNNLQLIVSLARLKSRNGRISISEIEDSINSMASAHEAIYKTERFDNILVHQYLDRIIKPIINGQGIEFNADIAALSKSIDFLIPLGLIITELTNNSIKHGFPNQNGTVKRISLSLEGTEKGANITYRDNGIGFAQDCFDSLNASSSFGIVIMKALAEQLRGEIVFSNDSGARVDIAIPIDPYMVK